MALGVLGLQVIFGVHFFVAGTLVTVLPRRKLWAAVRWVNGLNRTTSTAVGIVEVASAIGLMLDAALGLSWIAVFSGLCIACIAVMAGVVCRRLDDITGVEFSLFTLTAMTLIVWHNFRQQFELELTLQFAGDLTRATF